jgi:glycerol-3-phosphate acyltransferase PlsY
MGGLTWIAIGFLSGSIPFSVLIGRLVAGTDIRKIGDRNPGATNVFRAANRRWGVLAILLDSLKGAVPVGVAWFFMGFRDGAILLIALASVLGHAYSPWLKFRGGKAVAVTFGIWAGLTLGVIPTVLGLLLGTMVFVLTSSDWAVILAFLSLGWFVNGYYGPTNPEFVWIWLGNLLLLGWKHRAAFSVRPEIRPGLIIRIGGGEQ